MAMLRCLLRREAAEWKRANGGLHHQPVMSQRLSALLLREAGRRAFYSSRAPARYHESATRHLPWRLQGLQCALLRCCAQTLCLRRACPRLMFAATLFAFSARPREAGVAPCRRFQWQVRSIGAGMSRNAKRPASARC